jgi:hypothetical protein
MLVRLDERSLGGVSGVLVIAKHTQRNVEQRPLVSLDNLFVRIAITLQAPRDDRRIVPFIHSIHH